MDPSHPLRGRGLDEAKEVSAWRRLPRGGIYRVRQQAGDPDMENSVHSPGEHADGVLPETCGLPAEPTKKQKHWQ